jgi:PAS domain S-box-containing protein
MLEGPVPLLPRLVTKQSAVLRTRTRLRALLICAASLFVCFLIVNGWLFAVGRGNATGIPWTALLGIAVLAILAMIGFGILLIHQLDSPIAVEAEPGRPREDILAGIIDSAMDAILSIDEQHRIVLFNRAAERVFRCSREQAIGKSLVRFIPERFHEVHGEHLRSFGVSGQTSRSMYEPGTVVAQRWDGEEFPAEATISFAEAEDQRRYTVILRDVSERIRAEEELRLSNDRFEVALRGSPIVVSNQDLELRYTWIYSPALGFQSSNVVGRRDSEIFERPVDAAVTEAIKTEVIRSGASQRAEVSIYWRGEERYCDLLVDPLRDTNGKIVGVTCAAIDITARKQVESSIDEARRKAEQSEVQLRAVLANMSERLYVCDGEGNPVLLSESTRPTWATDEGMPMPVSSLRERIEVLAADGRPLPFEEWPISRVLRGERIRSEELLVRSEQGGELRVLRCSGAPILDREGTVTMAIVTSEDVTESKRIEEALRESEERFHALVEHASDAYFVHDLEGQFVDVNQQACESLGYAREELLRMTLCDVEMDFDLPAAKEAWRHIEPGSPLTLYGHQRRKDGTIFPVEARLGKCQVAGEQLVLGLVRDITTRTIAEEKLRISEEKFSRAFNTNPAAVVITRTDGTILDVNLTFERIFGQKRNQVLGSCSSQFWPTREERDEVIGKLLTNGSVYGLEQKMRRTSGEIFVGLGSASLIEVGGEQLIISTWLDISERKQAEEALRESEERLSLMIQAADLGVWDRDIVADRHNWSPKLMQIFGLPPDTTINYKRFLSLIHPDDRERIDSAIRASIENGADYNVEMQIVWSDGSVHWISSQGKTYFNESGKPIRMSGVTQDITQRKLAEGALIRSEKLASVGRMAAAIAHEINNPLAAITNLLFLAKITAGMPDSAQHYVETAEAELKRVAHITRQSLGFYRESNAPAQTHVEEVLDSAIDLLRSKAKAKHAHIEKQWRVNTPITAVAGELRQVFSNLLSNSLDAIENKGTIKFRVSHSPLTKDGQRRIRVTIADDGKGIGQGSLSHIFEPFFTTKGTVGTGLGLWVSRQIIEKHSGSIQVHSNCCGARHGTTFSILLPIDGPPSSSSATRPR